MSISQRLSVVAIAAAAALALTACTGKAANPQAAASPTPTPARTSAAPKPSPSTPGVLPTVPEKVACALLVPVAQDSGDVVVALSKQPDGTTIDRAQLARALNHLRDMETTTPDTLKPDVQVQLRTMQQINFVLSGMGNLTIQLEDFRASGFHIAERCRPYTG